MREDAPIALVYLPCAAGDESGSAWRWRRCGGLIAADVSAGNRYVDARICGSCHAAAARNYRQTGMGDPFIDPVPANTVEDFTSRNQFYHVLSDTYYSDDRARTAVTISGDGRPASAESLQTSRSPGSIMSSARAITRVRTCIAPRAEH